jgi:dihydropteroate synthase
MIWNVSSTKSIDVGLGARPSILTILNITPDSFSDGGRYATTQHVVAAAQQALHDGAIGFDVGGESTRPGARAVTPIEQIARVVPAIRGIRAALGPKPIITIDTTSAAVAKAALEAGADGINDQSAGLADSAMFQLAASRRAGMILMHRLARPAMDSYSTDYGKAGQNTEPSYTDVVDDVRTFLRARIDAARKAGLQHDSLMVDPGLGFGKTVAQNTAIIERTNEFVQLGVGVLGAASRKSFTARALGHDPQDLAPHLRDSVTAGVCVSQLVQGVRVFRVHNTRLIAEVLLGAWSAMPRCVAR